jgi:hypothetical protein
MIFASTLIALPLLAIAFVARGLRSDLEEAAWRLMSVAMLVVPLVSLLPKTDVGVSIPLINAAPVFSTQQPRLATDGMPAIFVAMYVAVAAVLFARLIAAAWFAAKLRRTAEPFGSAFICSSLRVPVTVGAFAPVVLLPADARRWSAAKLEAVLAHERAHVARRDPLWRCIGRAAVAVSWFHPLAWLAAITIERIAEQSADRDAVASVDRHEYANVILEFVRTMRGNGGRVLASGMLDGRALDTRIDAILRRAPIRRSRRGARGLLATSVAAAIFATAMTNHDAPPPRPRPTLAAQQQMHENAIRTRDEIRNRLRKTLRESLQSAFRGFDFD